MSSFILSDKHISTIARLLMNSDYVQDFANRLKACNIASVNYRYSETTRKTKCKLVSLDDCINVSMDDLFMLCKCWSYQACEGDLIDFIILDDFIFNKLDRLGYPRDYTPVSQLWAI